MRERECESVCERVKTRRGGLVVVVVLNGAGKNVKERRRVCVKERERDGEKKGRE